MHDLHGGRVLFALNLLGVASIVLRSSHAALVVIRPTAKRGSTIIVSESFVLFARNVLPVRRTGHMM